MKCLGELSVKHNSHTYASFGSNQMQWLVSNLNYKEQFLVHQSSYIYEISHWLVVNKSVLTHDRENDGIQVMK